MFFLELREEGSKGGESEEGGGWEVLGRRLEERSEGKGKEGERKALKKSKKNLRNLSGFSFGFFCCEPLKKM